MPLNQWSDDILIVEVSDEPALSEDMDTLMRTLDAAGGSLPDIIVDMKGVSYLNSTNIAQLLRLRKKLFENDRRMRICSVHNSVWSVLLITGLDQLFEFTDDVSTSLASLQIEQR